MSESTLIPIFLSLFFGISGPFIASFLALQVTRSLTDKAIHSDRRSQCLECGHPLAWYDLVPILSYLILKGKCRYCQKPFSVALLLSELLGLLVYGLFGFYIFANFRTSELTIFNLATLVILAAFFGVMLYLAIYDILTFSVPGNFVSNLLLSSTVVAIVLNVLRFLGGNLDIDFPLSNTGHLFTGLVLGLFVYILILATKQKGMGEGDIYIAALIGLFLGWPNGLMAMYFAIITGGLFGLVFVVVRRKYKGVLIPFVPFLLLGSVISIIIGTDLFRVIFYG